MKAAAAGEGGRKVGELTPPPSFIADRLAMWDRLKAASDEFLAAQVPEPIQVSDPNRNTVNCRNLNI